MQRRLTSALAFRPQSVIVTILVILMSSPAVLSAQSVKGNDPAYLALGDSYPFGTSCETVPCVAAEGASAYDLAKNDNWFVGYPDYLQVLIDRPLINPSCPGESTATFLSGEEGPVCAEFKFGEKLHVDYTTVSQMVWAENYLMTHDRVRLVTLHVGGPETNGLISNPILRGGCNYKYRNPTPEAEACIAEKLPSHQTALMGRLGEILKRIRDTGYSGRIIVLSYSWYTFNDYVASIAPDFYQEWDTVLQPYDAELAPVFEAFRAASEPYGGDPCAAGLQIQNSNGSCNIHPTRAGHQLIANLLFKMLQQ